MKNYEMSSNIMELSEHKTYIELSRRLCYYDYPNLNGVQLNSDIAVDKAQTLLMQPVVAKYRKTMNNDDLGGHEVSVDSKGNVSFGTVPIGVNVSVEVRPDTIEIDGKAVQTPCLFAVSRVWKRNKNVCSAIKRLFAEGKLHSSWELLTSAEEKVGNIRILTDYEFEADCLLGSSSRPAYGSCATTLEVASEDNTELLLSEAVLNDKIENYCEKEDKDLKNKDKKNDFLSEKDEKETIATAETVPMEDVTGDKTEGKDVSAAPSESEEASVEDVFDKNSEQSDKKENENTESTEVSTLTEGDLRSKIARLCQTKRKWCWVAFMFPTENYVLVQDEERESELEYYKVPYTVDGENVTIGDFEKIRLVVSVANINAEIAEKNNAIIKANEEITLLKAEIDSLSKYKEMYEQAEQEKAEKELSEKREELKKFAIKSGYISAEEIENSDAIKSLIDTVDENGIKAIIVDRLMAQKSDDAAAVAEKMEQVKSETASLTCNDEMTDYKSVMKKFLGK